MKVLPLFFLNNCSLFIIVQNCCWIDLNSIQLKKQQLWYIYYASSVTANLNKKKNNWQKHVIIFWLFLKNKKCIRATYRAQFLDESFIIRKSAISISSARSSFFGWYFIFYYSTEGFFGALVKPIINPIFFII